MFSSKDHFFKVVDDLLLRFNFSVDVRHFICCQSALETGFGTSRICLENHNLFGMKEPTVRPTTCIGSRSGYANYSLFFESVLDYVLWLSWTKPLRFRLNSIDSYSEHLENCHYAEDKDYISKIKTIYLQYYGS